MRALVQRVSSGGVYIDKTNYKADIARGLVILLGVTDGDGEDELNFVADKCSKLRIFDDDEGKMNLSVKDVDGEVLVISQFTLYGETRKGNRPSYTNAAEPGLADKLYIQFINRMKANLGNEKVKTGQFGAMMEVKIINDGPVTLLVESK